MTYNPAHESAGQPNSEEVVVAISNGVGFGLTVRVFTQDLRTASGGWSPVRVAVRSVGSILAVPRIVSRDVMHIMCTDCRRAYSPP